MVNCELLDSCNFFNEQATDMPHTKGHLKSLYCNGASFTECALYLISKIYDKNHVPENLYPNDVHKLADFNLFEPHEDLGMYLKVIYTGGSSGWIRPSTLKGLKKSGKIIAFHYPEGWVDVRRRNHRKYNGVDRRRTNPEMFFAGFSSD